MSTSDCALLKEKKNTALLYDMTSWDAPDADFILNNKPTTKCVHFKKQRI